MPQLKINSHSPFSRSLPSLQHQQLRKKPRLGSPRNFSACIRNRSIANSKHASEMQTCLYDFCRRTRVTTYDRDKESGLDYAMARMYAGTGGRFTSPDQGELILDMPASLNRYVYGAADPINHEDPSGNDITLIYFPTSVPAAVPSGQIVSPRWFSGDCPWGTFRVGRLCMLNPGIDSASLSSMTFNPYNHDVSKVRTMFSRLQTSLRGDKGCAEFLAGADWRKYKGKRLDEKMTWMLRNSRLGVAELTGKSAFALDQKIVIDTGSRSHFFDSSGPTFSGYQAGTERAQILLLLHELAHVMGVIPDDGADATGKASERNHDTVKAHCETLVNSYKGVVPPSIVPSR